MLRSVLLEASVYLREMTVISKDDIPLMLIAALFYAVYRFLMCRIVLKSFAKILRVKKETKFIHRTFDAIHYCVATILGVAALARRPYGHCIFWAKNCGKYMGQNPNGFECTGLEKLYYIVFLVYYVVDVGYTSTVNEPYLIMVHHFVTISMTITCVALKSAVTGLSIMVLHDMVDMPLYVGKVMAYLGFSRIKDIFLLSFAALCTWMRIINFPFIIKNCIIVALAGPEVATLYRIMTSFLCVLYVLHLIWQYKIFASLWAVVKGKGVHDNRSDNVE
jgi:hypothetical protein